MYPCSTLCGEHSRLNLKVKKNALSKDLKWQWRKQKQHFTTQQHSSQTDLSEAIKGRAYLHLNRLLGFPNSFTENHVIRKKCLSLLFLLLLPFVLYFFLKNQRMEATSLMILLSDSRSKDAFLHLMVYLQNVI